MIVSCWKGNLSKVFLAKQILGKEKDMKFLNKETLVLCTALLILLTIIPLTELHSTVEAQIKTTYDSYIYVTASPDPVGLGQTVLIATWTAEMPPDIGETAGTVISPSTRAGWYDITLTLTDPDGETQTIKLPYTDPVGNTWYTFLPTKVGTYSIQTHFPNTWKNTTTLNRLYKSADSNKGTFVVQQEPLQFLPGVSLPTEYWTRPIYAYNREWYQIAGNWLGPLYNSTSSFNPYTKGPETAHIMWTKPLAFGGITGGTFDDLSYFTGSAYEQKWKPPIILNGVLFYNDFPTRRGSYTSNPQGYVAVDLRTGEQLWWQNSSTSVPIGSDYNSLGQSYGGLTFGQLYNYESPNQHGVLPYLWVVSGNTWEMHDALTGRHWLRITNVPSGTQTEGTDGSILIYQTGGVGTNRWLALWNSSKVIQTPTASGTGYWQWRPPYDAVINGSTAGYGGPYSWNKTIQVQAGSPSITYVSSDVLIASATLTDEIWRYGISLKQGEEGRLMWSQKYARPTGNQTINLGPMGEGVFITWNKELRQLYGYDAYTGNQIWGPTNSHPVWDMYGMEMDIAYGKLYTAGWSGVLHAYDLKTGELLWNFTSDPGGLNGPYPNWPFRGSIVIADHKIYVTTDEHSHTQPLYKAWKIYCVDTETGIGVWNTTGLYTYSNLGIADGYLVGHDSMDNQIYCYGKGPSAITVEAPLASNELGKSLVIQGTVLDIASGSKQKEIAARFPNGLPAIADIDMTTWMEYVYKQMPIPTDVTGVSVTIDVIDSNGNYRNIGSITSDAKGFYSYAWQPDISGKYTIIATFEGSKSYYPSSAQTAFIVDEAPPPPTEQPIEALPPTEMYVLGIGVAIIVAVAIVGALLALMIRKRP
jgi:hypothetical protein